MSAIKERELQNILRSFDVPSFRKTNLPWLHKNLSVRNSSNSNYDKAIELIGELMIEKNLAKHK